MSKRSFNNQKNSGDTGDHRLSQQSDRLLKALAQQEIVQLMDVLFAVLSPELQEQAIAQLAEDMQQNRPALITRFKTIKA